MRQLEIALLNWRLLGGWYAARLFMSVAVAYPVARVVAASGIAEYPRGDALLFEPGGVLLVDVLRVDAATIGAAVRSAAVVTWLAAIASLVPLAFCLTGLAKARRARLREISGEATEILPTFVLLSGLTILAQALVIVISTALIVPLVDPLRGAWPGLYADATLAALFGLAALCVLGVGVANDLARATVSQEHSGAWPAAKRALGLLAAHPVRVLKGWIGPSSVAAVLIALGALGATAVDVSRAEPWRIVALLALHQLVAGGLIVTRATWLVHTLQLAERPTVTGFSGPDDRSAGNDEPPDPSSDPTA